MCVDWYTQISLWCLGVLIIRPLLELCWLGDIWARGCLTITAGFLTTFFLAIIPLDTFLLTFKSFSSCFWARLAVITAAFVAFSRVVASFFAARATTRSSRFCRTSWALRSFADSLWAASSALSSLSYSFACPLLASSLKHFFTLLGLNIMAVVCSQLLNSSMSFFPRVPCFLACLRVPIPSYF